MGSTPITRSMFGILSKITRKRIITKKIELGEAGLYFYLVFPIAFAFLITFMTARIFSIFAPNFYLIGLSVGHVHHFVYGFFILAISGYLALVNDSPKTKYLISLLHGFGLGLSFDEFGLWLNLRYDDLTRWNYDGFLIIIGFFFLILSANRGLKMLMVLWPFGRK